MHIRSCRASELRCTCPHQTLIVGRRTRSACVPSSGVGIILTTIPIRTVVVEIPTPRALRRTGHAVPSRTRLRLGRGSGKNSRTQKNRAPKKYLRKFHAFSIPHPVPNEKIHSPRCQEADWRCTAPAPTSSLPASRPFLHFINNSKKPKRFRHRSETPRRKPFEKFPIWMSSSSH